MPEFLAATKPVVIQVPEASGGASLESILVFIGGVIAAIAAVVAALLTTRAASKRLEKSLAEERQRFDRQLEAESKRIENQFDHERYLSRRSEASTTIEQIARSVSRTAARLIGISLHLLNGRDAPQEELVAFDEGVDELREEFSILAIRFGEESEVVDGLAGFLRAANDALPSAEDEPLGAAEKAKLEEKLGKLNAAYTEFLNAARTSIDAF